MDVKVFPLANDSERVVIIYGGKAYLWTLSMVREVVKILEKV